MFANIKELLKEDTDTIVLSVTRGLDDATKLRVTLTPIFHDRRGFTPLDMTGTPEEFDGPVDFTPLTEASKSINEAIATAAKETIAAAQEAPSEPAKPVRSTTVYPKKKAVKEPAPPETTAPDAEAEKEKKEQERLKAEAEKAEKERKEKEEKERKAAEAKRLKIAAETEKLRKQLEELNKQQEQLLPKSIVVTAENVDTMPGAKPESGGENANPN